MAVSGEGSENMHHNGKNTAAMVDYKHLQH
jgi:hypothetical protein